MSTPHTYEIDYDPFVVQPKVGMWVTFCCDCDAEPLKTEEDVTQFLTCPLEKDGRRMYCGEHCKAYKSVYDLVSSHGRFDTEEEVLERCIELLKDYP